MKNVLIFEKLNNVSDLKKEESSDGYMRLSGVFGVCGIRNNNKRVYSKDNYSKMVAEMQKRIKTEGVPGQLEHPSSMNIDVNNVSHMVESIDIDENGVVSGTIKLLHTPKGKIAEEIVKGGLPLFVSSRASGKIDESGNVTLEELKTYDIVGTPGFSQARMEIKENQICESVDDNMYMIIENKDDNMDEIQKQLDESLEMNRELQRSNMDLQDSINTLKHTNEKLADRLSYLESKLDNIEDSIDESVSNQPTDNKELLDTIQSWITEEYSKDLQNWIVEEYSKDLQNWIVEEYSKDLQNWIVEEYSNSLQEWITKEYSKDIADGIQSWIIEEFAPKVDEWCNEEFKKSIVHESKDEKLNSIDQILEMLDTAPKKPVISRKTTSEPYFIQNMPESLRPKWEMANESVKDSITKKARLYNLSNEDAIKKFWENVDFQEPKYQSINEGLENVDPIEKNLRLAIRRKHNA